MAKKKQTETVHNKGWERLRRQIPYHLMLLPGLVVVIIFSYGPMFGLVMAFQNFKPIQGFFNSKWVGLENFRRFFAYPNIGRIVFNTVYIAVFKMALGLVVPVAFAVFLNEVKNKAVSGFIQTVTCLPYFLSWVIMAGILINILSPSYGVVNSVIKFFGGKPLYFLGDNRLFPWTMIISDVWKGFGYSSIIYLAAISSIDTTLYEAARVDGASRMQQIAHVTLPGIRPMIFVMMVMSLGGVLNAGFDQIFNLYSPQVYASGDILDTFIYRIGMEDARYSFSTAVGLMKSLIALVLIAVGYKLADKYGDYRVF